MLAGCMHAALSPRQCLDSHLFPLASHVCPELVAAMRRCPVEIDSTASLSTGPAEIDSTTSLSTAPAPRSLSCRSYLYSHPTHCPIAPH